jgi:enoyl-CoA hydratase
MGERTPLSALAFPSDDAPPPRGPMGPTRLELSKPVIAASAGPAVAGGMELALWCDLRVMEQSAYMGIYCRRWGVPPIDGGTARLPRIVGRGRALDIILTDRKVPADECLRIGPRWNLPRVGRNAGTRDRAVSTRMSARRPPLRRPLRRTL